MLQKEEAKKQKSESKKGVRPKAKALNPWPAKSEKRDVATVKAEKKEKKRAKDDVLLQTKGAMKSKDVETDGMQAAAPQCACENPGHGTFSSCTSSRTCACNGRARLGYGSRWSSWKDVQGSIQCTNGAFGGDPHPGQAKECQCEAALNYIGAHASGLDLCQGDCDNDSDCQGSLVCFQRHGNNYATVPGCAGTPYADNEDYCVQVSSSMLQKEEAKKQKSESKKGVRPKAKALNPWPAKSEKRDVATVKAEKKEKKRAKDDVLLQTKGAMKSKDVETDGMQAAAPQCACENPGHGTFSSCTSSRTCACNGRARLGYGSRWSSWKDVQGSIQCTNGAFGGDPHPGQAKECQCEAALNYIGAHASELDLCQGDCDNDSDCQGSLVCFQ